MTNKKSGRQPVSIRIDGSLINQARERAKVDYGDPSRLGLVVEDALTKYLAAEIRGDQLETILSAAEGALYSAVAGKIEREFDNMMKRTMNRIGNLIAVSSYDASLTSVLMETMFKNNPQLKQYYEECRRIAAERMRNRWEKEGAPAVAEMLKEKKASEEELIELRKKVEKLTRELKQEKERRFQITEKNMELEREVRELKSKLSALDEWAKGYVKFMIENGGITRSNRKLTQEYEQQKPYPRVKR